MATCHGVSCTFTSSKISDIVPELSPLPAPASPDNSLHLYTLSSGAVEAVGTVALFTVAAGWRSLLTYLGFLTSKDNKTSKNIKTEQGDATRGDMHWTWMAQTASIFLLLLLRNNAHLYCHWAKFFKTDKKNWAKRLDSWSTAKLSPHQDKWTQTHSKHSGFSCTVSRNKIHLGGVLAYCGFQWLLITHFDCTLSNVGGITAT